MGIDQSRLRPSPTPLKEFLGETIQPVGSITLILHTITTMIDFLVVKTHSSYNAIIGCPTLNALKAITSTYHQKMKFSTKTSIGEVCGE